MLLVLLLAPSVNIDGLSDVVAYFATLATLFLCIVILYMKFGLRDCPLDTSADNRWTFGQWLIIIMAVAPFRSEDFNCGFWR
jgi:hypothetical protein